MNDSTTFLTPIEVAKILRRQLREQSPGVKFSVSSERGSAHGWLHISWTDGPREADVEALCRPWQGADFNGQTDGYDLRDTMLVTTAVDEMPRTVRSHVRGITYYRAVSSEARLAAQEIIRESLPDFTAVAPDGRYGPDAGTIYPSPKVRGQFPPRFDSSGWELTRWVAEVFL